MSQYIHGERRMSIETPLGKDVLLLSSFRGTEAVSGLFGFELELLSENSGISFEDIIGKPVSIALKLVDRSARYFHGIVCRFSQQEGRSVGAPHRLSSYRALMVPWTWLLTRTVDSRIFQNLSVPEILEKIFKEKGFSGFSMEVQEQHEKREFCVQYRETDFNFISRLMEEEGIYYYFTHDEKSHTMVIADTSGKHRRLSRGVRFQRDFGGPIEEDTIFNLGKTQEIQAGKYSLNDFNFEIPRTRLETSVDSSRKLGPGEREMYDYPGGYTAKASGDRLTRIRMEEQEARITIIAGTGNCREFTSGYRFTLESAWRQDIDDKDFLITSVEHEGTQGWENEAETTYSNRFTCIPFSVPFRPERLSAKPVIHGSQTAMVVGPGGDEIYTDKYGRVKVQFHWDREGKRDENASCWIRVGQIWAGRGWGAVWIPRIGHEVVVNFLEGDPDRPLITGSVYDGVNMPPYPLPEEMTKSTIKSNSSKGGGGFNELRFEDKKGGEEIYLQGEKDWNILIKNDKTQEIGRNEKLHVMNDRDKDVDGSQSETIGIDKTIKVKGNHAEAVGKDMTLTVGANLSESIRGGMTRDISKNKTEDIGNDSTITIGGDLSEDVKGSMALTVAKDLSEQIDGKHDEKVADDYTLRAKRIRIEAEDEVSIKTGSAEIVMKKNGDIVIEGKKIGIKGSGDIVIKGSKILGN